MKFIYRPEIDGLRAIAVLAVILIISSVVGAQIGVITANKLRGEDLRALLAIIVLVVAAQIAAELFIQPDDLFNFSHMANYK